MSSAKTNPFRLTDSVTVALSRLSSSRGFATQTATTMTPARNAPTAKAYTAVKKPL